MAWTLVGVGQVDTDFKHGEKMEGVHELMGISPEISKRLIAAAKERSTWDRDNDEDLVAGKKSGWLHKQGSLVKNWKRRWFVLDYPHLRYYASPEDTTPKGEINCTEVTLTEKHAVAVGREHCFAMYHPDRRTFFLQSEDEDQMMRWVQAIRHNSAKVSAIDFEEKALIGQGNFGKVLLVRHKRTDGFYAMKIMSKESLRRQDVEHTKTERSVLQALAGGVKHPFVVKLNFAFQTPGAAGKLYMVMDYVPGGDLYYHLRRRRRFSEDVVKVWAAELSDAIGYVHSLGIVFRDLKLENLLLDGKGHVHLADFGLSKQVDVAELSSYRLRTFCGTPFYMAPELVKTQRSRRGQRSAGYTKEVDWWAVGVIIFELLTGNPPFNAQSMQELYRKIAEHPMPDVLAELKRNSEPSVQEPMANLVRDLLTRDPDERLGHGEADRDAVRLHMAFEGARHHDHDWHPRTTLPPTESAGHLSTLYSRLCHPPPLLQQWQAADGLSTVDAFVAHRIRLVRLGAPAAQGD
jgi:serine/threonine protein kinase